MKKRYIKFGHFILYSRVSLNYSTLTVPEKIQQARAYVTAMTGNANFVSPEPKLVDVTAAVDQLEISYEASLTGGPAETQQMYADLAVVDALVNSLSGYVQSISNGDNLIILSAGMDVKKSRTPAVLPAVPEGMVATTGALAGSISFKWKTNKKVKGYLFDYCADPLGGAWTSVEGIITKSKFTLTGLETGKKYWGRVRASNSAGTSNPSDPAMAWAL